MVSERVAKIRVKRELGNLYYVKSDEEGWLCIYKAKLNRGGKKKKDDKKDKVIDDKIIDNKIVDEVTEIKE